VVLKLTLLYESIIVQTNYILKSLNILHDMNRLASKNEHNFLPLNVITPDFVQRIAEYKMICCGQTHYSQTDACALTGRHIYSEQCMLVEENTLVQFSADIFQR